MFSLPILSLFCAVLSTAETICYTDPELILPPIASCTRALQELQTWLGECGMSTRDFGPAPVSPGVIRLPQNFIDPQNDSLIKCGISVFWAPRPMASPPGRLRVDQISPTAIFIYAARIMHTCAYEHGEAHHQQYPLKLGYAWIWPRQWVLVQFHAIRHGEGNSSDSGDGNGNLAVMMGDGVNTTVDARMFNLSTCGSPVTLQNEWGNATEAVETA